MNPRVSICIPAYNQGQFVGECVRSALNQTYRDIEVVVSVNHCTDNTEEVLRQFSDPRLRLIRPPEFLPGADNFLFCISNSRGHYFAYLCSDDLLLPEFIESQVEIMEKHPRVAFVHCAAERIDEEGNIIRLEKSIHPSYIREGSEELKRYIGGTKCVGDACLIRRSAYDAVGSLGKVFFWDWQLCIRLLQYGDVAYNQKVLMKYRDWWDEYRAGERQWELFLIRIDFYEYFQPELLKDHPEWLPLFKKARRRAALSAITTFMASRPRPRREIKEQILRLSDSRKVKTRLFLVVIGLGFIWRWKKGAINWLRNRIKPLLYALIRKQSYQDLCG